MTTIPLGPALLTGSSDLPGGFGRAVLFDATGSRRLRQCLPIWPCSVRGFACHLPYSRRGALLPHLFTLTSRLTPSGFARGRPHRTNSTGPVVSEPWKGESNGGMFSVPLVLQVTLTGRYPAHCPVEFGLSSPRLGSASLAWGRHAASEVRRAESSGDHLADCGAPNSLSHGSIARALDAYPPGAGRPQWRCLRCQALFVNRVRVVALKETSWGGSLAARRFS